jgi:hypothetical protein
MVSYGSPHIRTTINISLGQFLIFVQTPISLPMLNRIWDGKRQTGKSASRPFQSYSLFGDPTQRFADTPQDHNPNWHLPGSDPALLRMVLGVAWLNHLPVRIVVPNGYQAQQATRIVQEAVSWVQEMVAKEKSLLPDHSNNQFPLSLSAWKSTTHDFTNSLKTIQLTKFGSINSYEVAATLLRLYAGLDSHPFHWLDDSSLLYTPEEYQEIYQVLESAVPRQEALLNRPLLSWLDINPKAVSNWTSVTLRTAVKEHTCQLEELIKMYETCLFDLRQHLKKISKHNKNQSFTSDSKILSRLTLGTLDADALAASRLPHWQRSYHLFEHDLLSTGWFAQYKGMQAISLEETAKELDMLLRRLQLIEHSLDPVLEAALAFAWLQELPSPIRKLIQSSAHLITSNNQDNMTFWYLFSWLERAIPAEVWKTLEETPERKDLCQLLPKQAIAWFLSGTNAQFSSSDPQLHCTIHEGQPATPPFSSTLDLYWGMSPDPVITDYFAFTQLEEPRLPMEYARLLQMLDQEPWAEFHALPYPLSAMHCLWEGLPGRWHEASFQSPEGVPQST